MMASKRPQCLCWAVGLLLLVVGHAQSPRYTFNPSNYVPPAGEAPLSTSLIKTVQGRRLLIVSGKYRNRSRVRLLGMKRHLLSTMSHLSLRSTLAHLLLFLRRLKWFYNFSLSRCCSRSELNFKIVVRQLFKVVLSLKGPSTSKREIRYTKAFQKLLSVFQ